MIQARYEFSIGSGFVAAIDADDWERQLWVEFADGHRWSGRPCDVSWRPLVKPHTVYAVVMFTGSDGKLRELRLHRLVMCARGHDIVDHDDGNGLHCWRTNLRFVTNKQNQHNRVATIQTSSKYKGVSFHTATGKWTAQIRHEGRKIHLGLFAEEVIAAGAYDLKARQLFGSTACLNFPLEPASSAAH